MPRTPRGSGCCTRGFVTSVTLSQLWKEDRATGGSWACHVIALQVSRPGENVRRGPASTGTLRRGSQVPQVKQSTKTTPISG